MANHEVDPVDDDEGDEGDDEEEGDDDEEEDSADDDDDDDEDEEGDLAAAAEEASEGIQVSPSVQPLYRRSLHFPCDAVVNARAVVVQSGRWRGSDYARLRAPASLQIEVPNG